MRRFLDWTSAQAATSLDPAATSPATEHARNCPSPRRSPHPAHSSPAIREADLQQLTKLLHEIKYYQASSSPIPSAIGSQSQRDFIDKVHETLPLFLTVFASHQSNAAICPTISTPTSDSFAPAGFKQSISFDEWTLNDSASSTSKPSSPLPPSRSPQMDRFPDLSPFAFIVARLFVSEIRQRASDKRAEDASLAILQFLNPKEEGQPGTRDVDDNGPGWTLLLALDALANSQSKQIIQILCEASLPSTLIKCLYLFFDLPAGFTSRQPEHEQDSTGARCNLNFAKDITTGPLIRAFTQLLVQLCSHQSGIDELIRKDDLRLLVGIASSQCLPHNRPWRKTAFQVLLAISKNMHENFMYLEQNICIQVYVENMHRINSLNLANVDEFVDMITVLIEFIYNLDVDNRNQPRSIAPIIDQFKSSRILELIEELLFRIDDTIMQELNQLPSETEHSNLSVSQLSSVSSELGICLDDYRRCGRRLVYSFATMAKINHGQDTLTKNTTLKPLSMSRFEMFEQFRMPKPSARDCILNNEALKLCKMAWSRCQDNSVIEAVLDATISLFNDDKYNFFIFESQQLLVYYMASSNFTKLPNKIKQKLFKFLEFIIIETNYIPCLELGTTGTMIKSKSAIDQMLALRTCIACLRFNSRFSDIFREIGLFEIVIETLNGTVQDEKLNQQPDKLEVLYLLLETSQYLLAGPNNQNCVQFNESGAARHVFNCLSKPKFFQIFIPPHSSSSDDGAVSYNSRNSTPTPTNITKLRHSNQNLNMNESLKLQNRSSAKQMQKIAFTIIRQLILSNAGDEYLANLLGLLARNLEDIEDVSKINESSCDLKNQSDQSLDPINMLAQEINLKIYILRSLVIILKDSHRCRTVFRKVEGFVYVISSLISLERALAYDEEKWRKLNGRRIWRLIKSVCMTIVIAMRSEPSNHRTFSQDVLPKFTDAIRKLGCFNSKQVSLKSRGKYSQFDDQFQSCKSVFLAPPTRDLSTSNKDNVKPSEACCQLLRFLYDMSLNMVDGTTDLEEQLDRDSGRFFRGITSSQSESKSHSFDHGASDSNIYNSSNILKRRSQLQKTPTRLPSLDLNMVNPEPAIITFPCIIISILDLIPSLPGDDLMTFTCMVIKSLFKHEQNQQTLCESGMIAKLLDENLRVAIMDKDHFLHDLIESMLEKLTKQAISPLELTTFFRMNDPLWCKSLDMVEVDASKDVGVSSQNNALTVNEIASNLQEMIPTTRIRTLVNMMTDEKSKSQPPFAEFNLGNDGCAFIFLPSIAPVNAKSLPPNTSSFLNSTLDVHTTEKNGILGGVGTLERQFPPTSGLTFSSWICIKKFPPRSQDANHNIHLLTIYRGSAATGKEYSCFRVQISALDRALTISTQEVLLFDNENRPAAQTDPDCVLRLWTPETLLEERWHHIAITLSKSPARQSLVQVYIDGVPVHCQRLNYINSYVGCPNSRPLGSSNQINGAYSAAAFVNAFIGSLPQFRAYTKAIWKQGPCHLIEEPLNGTFIASIYSLGPSYSGNFQSTIKMIMPNKQRSSKYDKSDKHKLVQQQSAYAAPTSRHDLPLTRVSSSGFSSAHHPNQSGQTGPNSAQHISEDRIIFNLDARATSMMTLSRMRKIYTRFDCRQISRVLGVHENAINLLLLHNTGVHLNGPSRSIGALTIGYGQVRCFIPSPTELTLSSIGGSYVLLGLIAQAQTTSALLVSMKALVRASANNQSLQSQMDNINGYQILAVMFYRKKHLLNEDILKVIFALITGTPRTYSSERNLTSTVIQQVGALRDLICECFDLWLETDMINIVLEFIHDQICSVSTSADIQKETGTRTKNLKCLREMDLLPRMLRLLPRDRTRLDTEDEKDRSITTFDAKAIYLIKQTIFELLNKTPRQSDILYFGQFLASLLPRNQREKSVDTINLRNVLLKSLLQMMTNNKQHEVNLAMQEELVRILGFDWFILFISGPHLSIETITLGFLNLTIILSNESLYANFKDKQGCNGGWLKEPIFPTMDGKFNIQLLGINVEVFFGLGGTRKSICRELLETSNFVLLNSCLTKLAHMPRIYLMLFQTTMGRLSALDSTTLETISDFNGLSLDLLCDRLMGETHHKRRLTLSSIQFRSLELSISLVHMIREIMIKYNETAPEEEQTASKENLKTQKDDDVDSFPTSIVRFLMYLYNNNSDFQAHCRQNCEFIDALCDALIRPEAIRPQSSDSNGSATSREMVQHPASKEVLDLCRLIILDQAIQVSTNGEVGTLEQLKPFERFMESLAKCRLAQDKLVSILLKQILLMIDSTARHNSIKTIGSSENSMQFQLLLINSINMTQIITDKIWSNELLLSSEGPEILSGAIDDMINLTEQVFKFNELLPKHNPPYAFIMQRVLNRLILFALWRANNRAGNMRLIVLLKKIIDNRNLIILSHMHSPHSAEFFVCLTHLLTNIIEENSLKNPDGSMAPYGLMMVALARKLWDAVYQSKKGVLSEALDVSLSLPAFTLDTSLDLIQIKPDIKDSCEKYWSNLVEEEQRPRRRLQHRTSEPNTGSSTAVNILSGRLTRVVNAANFVSRVVGATAGSMASNVNLVGERLSQSRMTRRENSSSDSIEPTAGQNVGLNPDVMSNDPTQPGSQQISPCHSSGGRSSQHLTSDQICSAQLIHISIIDDYITSQMSQKNHKLSLHKYLCDEWRDMELEILLRERTLFGPKHGSELDKWCLDLTEGPRRMRKKMVNDTRQFFEKYAYKPEFYNPTNTSLRYRPPMSYDSHLYYLKTRSLPAHLFEQIDEKQQQQQPETARAVDQNQLNLTPEIQIDLPPARDVHSSIESLSNNMLAVSPSSSKPSDADKDDDDSTSFVDFCPEIEAETNSARESKNTDSLSVLRLLEKNERISHMFRCSRVQGLDTYEGLLLFGREHFYLIDGFTLLKTREIKDIDCLPPDAHDPIIPNSTPNLLSHTKKTCSKFSFESVIEVHKRRYLLQPIALEVFSSDGRNTLIVFPRNIRNKVYSRFMSVATQITNNAHESLAGQKSNVSVESGGGLLSNLIGETSVTQRWVRGELSNFQYLINLNTIAGRSYNDLMQYPVFPWIIADYDSDQLDLTNPSTFRDLSRPIGAQTSERLEQFKKRYAEWDDTETPPYHYGTFYSSAMIVASFMVRMEPFTQHFLRLQGGHFDLADRMFHSIKDSWLSASKHNMADIKELIPEFFYLPEFLENNNKYDLGIKQNGMKLDHVILPPWAKNDPHEFIRMHRCALESDYVSAHLHEWIDLIFGYKQQGSAAVDSVNVFHHLFYEGNVDIYNTDIDPIKKNAVIGFINNFGQVPKQLFKKPHPVRRVTCTNFSGSSNPIPLTPILPTLSSVSGGSNAGHKTLTHWPQLLKLTSVTFKDLRGPVGQIVQVDRNVIAVEQNKLLIPTEFCRYVAWGHADRSLRLGLYDSEKPIFVWEGSDNLMPAEVLCCTIPNSRNMLTAGTEAVITVWKIERVRSFTPIMNLYGHVEPITCLASSQAYSIIVSGSRDRTVFLWDLNKFTFVRQLGGGSDQKQAHRGPISAIAINDSTGDIATCASSWLYLWTINGELLASIDSQGVSIQQSMGFGSSISGPTNQLHILSVCFSQFNEWDLDEVIITGASDGSVAIWSLRYTQQLMTEEEIKSEQMKQQRQVTDQGTQRKSSCSPCETPCDVGTTPSGDHEQIPNSSQSSEPIAIQGSRKRTDTMNSEWVRLSASSASTADTIPVLTTTPTSDPSSSALMDNLDHSAPSSPKDPAIRSVVVSADKCDSDTRKRITVPGETSTRDETVVADEGDSLSMSRANLLLDAEDPSLIKFSKSDNSLIESFVMLDDANPGGSSSQLMISSSPKRADLRVRPQSSSGVSPFRQGPSSSAERNRRRWTNEKGSKRYVQRDESKLQPNHRWQREIYLRMMLPRRQNRNIPAAVTSLAISKDHRSLYIGDASGRISSWTVS